jgi:uncharacterized protein (TIGR00369 family)
MNAPMPFPAHIPFVNSLGLELLQCSGGRAELRMQVLQVHQNSWGVAHGGVLMTMLDVAMAQAARSVNADAPDFGPGVATVEMKTTFMRAAQGALRAVGTLMHRTPTMAFCEGSVFDPDGDLCAHGTATFKYLRALPAKRTIQELQRKDEST